MNSIRGGFIAAATFIPLAFACERSEPTPTEEPGRQTGPITRAEPERREETPDLMREEGARGAPSDEEYGDMPEEGRVPVRGTEPTAAASKTIDQIARARCAREQRCGNVGADEKFATKEACMSEVKNDWKDELDARECPGGIDQKELSECLTEIKNEDCSNPFDRLGRVVACGADDLCKGEKATGERPQKPRE